MYYDFDLLPRYLNILTPRLRIAVVYGGDKTREDSVIYRTHNPRSWKSYEKVAHDICQTLREIGFEHVYLLPDDMNLARELKEKGVHLVWLNTGGVQGYNPMCHTPSLLEMLGIPYIGHNPLNSSTLDNKHAFKRELKATDIDTPPFIAWDSSRGPLLPKNDPKFAQTFGEYDGPFIVKPVSGRASLHVEFVNSVEDLPRTVSEVYRSTSNHVLIEKFMPGREFCVSVCGHVIHKEGEFMKRARPFSFSAIERVLDEDERIFTSMDKRPIESKRVRLLDDENDGDLKKKLLDLAQHVYWAFNMKALVRLDVRCDENGKLQILEVNPKPDLKRPENGVINLVTVGLDEVGMTYMDLIYSLLADRMDYLFSHKMNIITHIRDLVE